jgi:hypothetical protein
VTKTVPKTKRKVRILRNLVVKEVSGCDVAANPGARVMLMKRDHDVEAFRQHLMKRDDPVDEDAERKRQDRKERKRRKKMKLQKQMRKFAKRVAKLERAPAHNPDPSPVAVAKTASEPLEKRASRVEAAMDAAVASLRQADQKLVFKSRDVAVARIAGMREHADLWREYRAVEALAKSLPTPGPGRMADTSPGGSIPVPVERVPPLPVVDSQFPTVDALVDKYLKENPGVSRPKAYSHVVEKTPEGAEAFRREQNQQYLAQVGIYRQVAVAG